MCDMYLKFTYFRNYQYREAHLANSIFGTTYSKKKKKGGGVYQRRNLYTSSSKQIFLINWNILQKAIIMSFPPI